MVSRENRVILLGMGSAVVVAALSVWTGFASVSGTGALTYVLAIPGLALLAPQLYLAHTATDPTAARRHRRVGLGLSGLLVLSLASNLPPTGELLVGALGGSLLVILAVTEAREGYRDAVSG